MMPDIIGKPHTWCYKFLGWRLKLTKSAFRRISQLKLVPAPAPGHWSGRHCLGSGRLRVSELAAGSLAAAYLGLETPQTGCMQCCSYLSGLQRFTDHTQHTSCLWRLCHPWEGSLVVLTAAGEGVQGWILFTVAAGWCPGTACCSVSGPRGVAATTTVTARLLAGTGAAAVSGPAGCSACVVCSTATLCTTLSRQAVSTACTLTSIFRKLGARLLSGCIPQFKIFYRKISHTFTYCQNDK